METTAATLRNEKPFDLVERMADISSQLDESVDVEKVMKKIRFMCYECHAILPSSESAVERLTGVRDFFFFEKRFTPKAEAEAVTEDDYLLHRVLQKRQGSAVTISLLFQTVAEHVGLQLEMVEIEGMKLLKLVENGQSHFFDLMRGGVWLPKNEVLDLLNRAYATGRDKTASLLESLRSEQIFGSYLMGLRKAYRSRSCDQSLLKVLNIILNFQSSDIKLFAERALLKNKMGSAYEALLDFKRYFSFYGENQSPPEIVEIYRKLKGQFTEN